MLLSFSLGIKSKFIGAKALSERWIECVCHKRVMLNKPRAMKFFETSK